MTDVKKYKRIGWVVQTKFYKSWFTAKWSLAGIKSESIKPYNNVLAESFDKYQRLKRKGLARCVPVYVEVLDES